MDNSGKSWEVESSYQAYSISIISVFYTGSTDLAVSQGHFEGIWVVQVMVPPSGRTGNAAAGSVATGIPGCRRVFKSLFCYGQQFSLQISVGRCENCWPNNWWFAMATLFASVCMFHICTSGNPFFLGGTEKEAKTTTCHGGGLWVAMA